MHKFKTKNETFPSLKVGDVISYTDFTGHLFTMKVTKVTEKSWYHQNIHGASFRNSYGTLLDYQKRYQNFKIA